MAAHESAEEINDAAAVWVVRLDRDSDPAIAAALESWLGGDPRRRGAFLRSQAIWRRIERMNRNQGAAQPELEQMAPRTLWPRRVMMGGALAAVVVAAMFFGIGGGTTYGTRVGEQSREALADGSVIVLNTASTSRVDLTSSRREVNLERGEALFSVAKDKRRPFIVTAGPIRVEAVGTAFTVRRFETGARVVVTEGSVRAWSELNPDRFISIEAGQRAFLADETGASDAVTQSGGIDEALAWRRGMIALDGMTLVEAAAEFNRYNSRQVAIDERFVDKRLVGWFEARDIDGFARAAATVVGGRVEEEHGTLRITR